MHEVAAAVLPRAAGEPGRRASAAAARRARRCRRSTIDQLGLGFAPQPETGCKSRLLDQGFSQGLLLQSGLVVQRDDGEVVDRFRNRLMVPICRDTGSVIAFGGRAMDADQVPKYLNSPETPIYSKGRTLYGLHLIEGARSAKLGYAVLVEGYFDFAQVFQTRRGAGRRLVRNGADAAAGAAAAAVHDQDRPSFDPDAAGQGAAARSCELLVAEGFDVNVVMLDKGEDPDTFIRHKGAGALP